MLSHIYWVIGEVACLIRTHGIYTGTGYGHRDTKQTDKQTKPQQTSRPHATHKCREQTGGCGRGGEGVLCFHFHFFPNTLPFYLLFLPCLIAYLGGCCPISTGCIPEISFCGFLILLHCGPRTYFLWFQSFLNLWRLICGPAYGLFWRRFHMYLRRTCILVLVSVAVYRCLSGLVNS